MTVVRRGMLDRPVDPARYRGVVREDRTLRWARDAVEEVERLRTGQPDPTALRRLAGLLTELGWDDLAAMTWREELAVLHAIDATRDEIGRALTGLRDSLLRAGAYEEALAVTDEQLRSGADRDARSLRTSILTALGRHDEAAESAAVAVREAPAGVWRTRALTTYADRLDRAGRVGEAAEVTAEVARYWRRRADATPELARAVNLLSDRLVRSGRADEAVAVITKALPRLHRHRDRVEAHVWHDLAARLSAPGLAGVTDVEQQGG